jgi:hypothetical protein
MTPRPPRIGAIASLLAAAAFWPACGGDPGFESESRNVSCAAGCGGALRSAALPGPRGAVTLTAWSNSPQLGTVYDCDPTACAGNSPVTAQNGQPSYGCPWQCVELVNRYFQGTWGAPKIAANAGAGFCQFAASSSLPQYWVYGQYGTSTAGHAPMAGDVLVWSSHVAIAASSVAAGAAGALEVIQQNATCSGADTVSWNGSMFGDKYGLAALCWVHVVANTGATGPTCPTGGNWHLAGKYCGSEPGMQRADPNTLYSCGAAGGAASVAQVCTAGCQTMPAGQDDRCATPLLANGASCAAGNQCQSANCVAGVCCNNACGPCGSCGTGTCTPLPAGTAATCSPFVCDGKGAACPAGCRADSDCVAGDFCKAGACVARQANGAACSGVGQCQSANCVSGVCCDSACGPCGSCATGACLPLAAHSPASPACSGELLCSGSAVSCPAACVTSADCAGGTVCSASSCVPPVADAGVPIDGGVDAGAADAGSPADAGLDAGTPADPGADAGPPPDARVDAGAPAPIDDPSPAVSAGCASGGAAWTSCLALLALAIRRKRR